MRSSLPGRTAVGISLDLHPVRPTSEDARDAAAVLDAEQNRIFLEPVLHGTYPARARDELLPPSELIKPGDMRTISAPVDFLGLNYYSPYYVGLGDWDDLRRGETPLPGHPGLVNYAPPELPKTTMGWLVEPNGLYDTLVAARPRGATAADLHHRERVREPTTTSRRRARSTTWSASTS